METTGTDRSMTFDPETDTYRLHHYWGSDESVATTVIVGVAAITNTPPPDLEPLFETIDPESLDRLYQPTSGGSSRDDGRVSFEFNDCAVIVNATGEIEITPVAFE